MDNNKKHEFPMYPMMFYGTYPVPVPPQMLNMMGMQTSPYNANNIASPFMPVNEYPVNLMPQTFFGFGGFPEEIEPEIEPDIR